jgi:3-oxoacyl-[acyl-carrier protein] reductase
MIDLSGRKALITGGSRGIGRATAVLFARAGSDIAINYLSNTAAAEEVGKEVEKSGKKCLLLRADIRHRHPG